MLNGVSLILDIRIKHWQLNTNFLASSMFKLENRHGQLMDMLTDL